MQAAHVPHHLRAEMALEWKRTAPARRVSDPLTVPTLTCSTRYGGSIVKSMGSLALQMLHRRLPLTVIQRCRQRRCTILRQVHGEGTSGSSSVAVSSKQM
jgi:hypothetical protein